MDLQKITKLINQLLNEFTYENGKLIYNEKKQERISYLLTEISKRTFTFEKTKNNEIENIRYMSVIDRIDSDGEYLVDLETLIPRIEGVLENNNIHTSLKTLALSNKCAHIFDPQKNPMQKIENYFIKYYNFLYPNNRVNSVSFMDKREYTRYNSLVYDEKYDMDLFVKNSDEFDKLYNILFNSSKTIKRGTKISILKQLKINIDYSNPLEIEDRFNKVLKDKEKILSSYLVKKYEEGYSMVSLQNKLFAVKDNLISMIGQLLKDGTFNLKHELVRTNDENSGFGCMLVIDDKELSYYIEVHMPEYISRNLIKDYGFKLLDKRTTPNLGASAVYKRDPKEIKKIKKLLDEGKIIQGTEHNSKTRAEIITRDYDENSYESVQEEYSFETNIIADTNTVEPISFINYLISNGKNYKEIKSINLLKHNENYSKEFIDNIILDNYYSIYKSFSNEEKIDYIEYVYKNHNKDLFDNTLFNIINNIDISSNVDTFGKILIYEKVLKKNFIDKNSYKINDILSYLSYKENINNEYKKNFTSLIKDYIENIIDCERGNDNEKQRGR